MPLKLTRKIIVWISMTCWFGCGLHSSEMAIETRNSARPPEHPAVTFIAQLPRIAGSSGRYPWPRTPNTFMIDSWSIDCRYSLRSDFASTCVSRNFVSGRDAFQIAFIEKVRFKLTHWYLVKFQKTISKDHNICSHLYSSIFSMQTVSLQGQEQWYFQTAR